MLEAEFGLCNLLSESPGSGSGSLPPAGSLAACKIHRRWRPGACRLQAPLHPHRPRGDTGSPAPALCSSPRLRWAGAGSTPWSPRPWSLHTSHRTLQVAGGTSATCKPLAARLHLRASPSGVNRKSCCLPVRGNKRLGHSDVGLEVGRSKVPWRGWPELGFDCSDLVCLSPSLSPSFVSF